MAPSGGIAATASNLAAGIYTVTVTDDNETETVDVTITQPDELVLPGGIHNGNLGESYSFPASRATSGGTSPYSYYVVSGVLPPGLSLSRAGNITGTPTSAGNFSFRVEVTDAKGCTKSANFTLQINKSDQTIDFFPLASGIKYGDGPITLTASATSGLTVSYVSSNTAVATISGQTLTIVGAGTATITASQPGDNNWNAAANVTQTITVGKKQLNVTADVKGKVYGATDPAFTVSYSGFVNGDDKNDLGGTLSISRASGENVGAYPIMPFGQTSGNYDIYYTGNSLIINKAPLTVTADAKSKVYGAADPELTVSYSGFVNGDDKNDLGGMLSISRAVGEAVGSYAITPSGQTSGNYDIAYTGNNLTINKANLTVSADAKSKVYGATDPELTVSYSGFANGDDKDDLGGTLSISRAVGEAVGSYAITPSGQTSGNYNIAYIDNNLTIKKATLTVTATGINKVYDGSKTATVSLSDNRVSGDDITTAYTAATFDNKNVGTNKVVSVTGISIGGTDAGNYNLSNTNASTTANITTKTLTVTASGINKIYDGNNTATVTLNDDRVSGDVLTTAYTGAHFDTQHVGMGKTVDVLGIYIDGGTDAANYTVNTTASTTADITAKTLAVTADTKSKAYGDADPVLTYTATGFADGDDESILDGTLSREPGEDAGTYAIRLGSLGAGGNYTINFTGADFTITNERVLTITADAKSKTYGDADPELTYTATGFADGDDESILEGTLTREPGEDAGTYAVQLGSLSAGANYTLSFVGADFTINKASLTVTADAKTKVYGATDPALTYMATGFKNGDDNTIVMGSLNRATGEHVGDYAIAQNTLSAGGNYTIDYTGNNLTINKTTLTVTATGINKVYDGTRAASVNLSDNRVSGDVLTIRYIYANFYDHHVGTGKTVDVLGIYIDGGTDARNYTLSNTTTATTADITARTLTVTADTKSKAYGDADPELTYTATGFADGDDESILEGALSREPGEAAGSYAVRLGSLGAGANYTLSFVGADFTIGKKALTVTASAEDKAYDGSRDATVALQGDPINGDAVTVNYTGASFDTKDTGTDKTVEITGISLGGDGAGNYSLSGTTATTTADITAKALAVTASGINKIYDGNTVATVNLSDDHVSGDDITVRYTGAHFNTQHVGMGKALSVTGIYIDGGTDAGNYALSNTTASTTADITAKTLTVTASGTDKIYDGNTVATVNLSDDRVNSDDITTSYTTASFDNKQVGTGKAVSVTGIGISGPDAGNYTVNTTASTTADITAKPLTVTADTKSKTYGEADPELTYTATGFADGDDGSILGGALVREPGEAAGSYAIRLGSLGAGANYTINFTGADFTITNERVLTITADTKSKTYGDADPELTYTATGFADGDDESILDGTLSRGPGEDAGTYAIQLGSLGAGANYTLSFVGADFTIGKKALTVTADPKSKVYGDTDPALTYTATGFANGDDESILDGTLSREPGEVAGTYAIQLGSLNAGANYTLSFVGADFTITNERVLTITADAKSKTYGDADPELTYTATGFANGDDESILDGTLSREPGEDAGSYAIQLGSLSAGANYTINFTGADFTITNERVLTITADAKSKTYGDADPALTYTATGFADGDDGSILGGALTREPGEDAGSYAIRLGSLGAGANYTINFTGADFTITNERVLTVTADAKSKTYGDADPVLTYTATGFADGDDESILEGTLSREPGEDAGSYAIRLGSLGAGANYTINFTGADFTITNERILTITADTKSKTYGDADPELTYTATGFADGDDESILGGALTREPGEAAGTYAIRLGSLGAGANYTINFTGADFSIIGTDTTDTDGDGVPDDVETQQGTNPNDAGDYTDTDGDGVPDYVETQQGTSPNDARDYTDTDGDGVPDYVETQQGTSPNDAGDYTDTDGDGVADYLQARSIREFVSQDLSVAWGTPLDQLVLPAEVVAISSKGEFITMAVSWDLAGYSPLVTGTSPYIGAIEDTAGLFNPYDRVPALEITVRPKPAPLDVTLGNSEFTGSPDVFFQEIGAFTVVDPSDNVHGFMLPEGEGDNGYFEVKSGILFWSSADEAAGRTVFTVVLKVTDRAGNELVKPFTVRRQRASIASLELHNTFTPNGDGMNDMWGVPSLRYYSGVRIQVFDNGGQRLFYTEDADVRWDGKHRGKALPVGAYFYVVHVGETGETRRGVLNLLNR